MIFLLGLILGVSLTGVIFILIQLHRIMKRIITVETRCLELGEMLKMLQNIQLLAYKNNKPRKSFLQENDNES